ncbi:MAG TPA: UDP-3-O-(3-hydroxymyristoyl)glucosamine N-acyltransferase [Nitrospirota bacterium]
MKLKELADILGATLAGDGEVEILGAAGVREAGEGQITFITGKDRLRDLEQCRASAVIVPADVSDPSFPLLRVKNPRYAFARALAVFHVAPYTPTGVSDRAIIGQNVEIGSDCSIHAGAIVADGVKIGDRVTLYPGVYIGEGSAIDDDAIIYPNVSIMHGATVGKRVIIHAGTVLGSDGFGFVTDAGTHHKIPQVGGVIIEDDVELGANCTVDRATLGNTVIKKGTKIDNLVHIAHNVTIGEHCLLAGQAGVAGSSTLGDYVVLGGQAGVADHVIIGDRVMAGGGSAITRNVEPGQVIVGYYAMPVRDWLKVQAALPKLPEIKKTVSRLEKEIETLKGNEK